MNPIRIVGILLLVLGVVLLIFGWTSSDSIADQVSEAFTGRFTEGTMWYLIGGIAMIVVGGSLAAMGGRSIAR